MFTEFINNVMALAGWLLSLWAVIIIILFARDVNEKMVKNRVSLIGAVMMVVGKWVAAAIGVPLLLYLILGFSVPKMEEEAPSVAARSRTGSNILEAVENPCGVPGVGNVFCGDNPDRMGEAGPLASGEQAGTVADASMTNATTGPQPVLIQGEEALRKCYQDWFVSFQVDGASKITAGLPPDGKSQVTDWLPSNSGAAILVIETPVGINNNRGVLTHWLLPAAIELAQDRLKAWHEDQEGTWSVSGTGSWPQNCYQQPTQTQTQTQQELPAPPTPPSISPPGGLFLHDEYSNTLFVTEGTPLTWCYQDPVSGNWYACPPNQSWFWRP